MFKPYIEIIYNISKTVGCRLLHKAGRWEFIYTDPNYAIEGLVKRILEYPREAERVYKRLLKEKNWSSAAALRRLIRTSNLPQEASNV